MQNKNTKILILLGVLFLSMNPINLTAAVSTIDPDGTGPLPDYLILDGESKLGVGITSPPDKFTVKTESQYFRVLPDAIGITDKDFTNTLILANNKDTCDIYHNTKAPLSLQKNGGNVGIGITDPKAKLEVAAYPDFQQWSYAPNSTRYYLKLRGSNPVDGVIAYSFDITDYDGSFPNTLVLNHGNVGIGTVTPKVKLEVSSYPDFQQWSYAPNSTRYYLKLRGSNPVDGVIAYSFDVTDYDGSFPNTLVLNHGNVGIGTLNPTEKLEVNGAIKATEIKVPLTNWADFVFEPDYKLMSLSEVQQFITKHKHLPNVPSESEIKKQNQNLAKIQTIQMQKMEEMMLYILQLEKRISDLEKENKKIVQRTAVRSPTSREE